MTKQHTYGILVLIMLYHISTFTYNTVFDKPLVGRIESPAEESAGLSESAAPSSEDTVIIEDGQALGADTSEATADIPTSVTESTSNETPKAAAPTTSVSREGTTDIYTQLSKVNGSFGQFRYRDLAGGRIEVDPQWIANNIVPIILPGLNQRVLVNKKAADNFIKAFTLIKNGTALVNGRRVTLLSLVKTMDGTFVTRHVNWGGPTTGLSNHSWGTAIDINASNHYVGLRIDANSTTDPNAILWREAFQPAGFSWGNRYSVGPDSMHYELIK